VKLTARRALVAAMEPVFQDHLPQSPWAAPASARLPGVQPLDRARWLLVDEAYGGQMRLRDHLIATRRDEVYALAPDAVAAAQELLDTVLQALAGRDDYSVGPEAVTRPDGQRIALNRDDPLVTAGRLVQEDLCLLQKPGDEHILTGAILCFPAGWSLAEKFGRPLARIHAPVTPYDAGMARRVQRLFDAIRVEQPLWRANGFFYDDPSLFAPFLESDPRPEAADDAPYFRSERQCLLRLPVSRAVVFSIHSYMVRRADLSAAQIASLGQVG
jgi:Haem-dependent oxidative N-demethylase, alpha subunit-like